jgi:hypothetical protein
MEGICSPETLVTTLSHNKDHDLKGFTFVHNVPSERISEWESVIMFRDNTRSSDQ